MIGYQIKKIFETSKILYLTAICMTLRLPFYFLAQKLPKLTDLSIYFFFSFWIYYIKACNVKFLQIMIRLSLWNYYYIEEYWMLIMKFSRLLTILTVTVDEAGVLWDEEHQDRGEYHRHWISEISAHSLFLTILCIYHIMSHEIIRILTYQWAIRTIRR